MQTYTEWLKWTDVTTFDLYPVTGWNQPSRIPDVGLATKQLVGMARQGQAVWTVVEASDQELSWTPPETKGPTAAQMRAEVWMSIAAGAKGIGYFTISFGRNKNFQWNNLTDEIKAELKRTNGQLTELAGPIVLGDTDKKLTVTGDETKDPATKGHAIMAIRKEYQGKTYVIAVNMTPAAVKPTFQLETPPGASTADLYKENRTVDVKNATFTDDFAPLAVHIYQL
jgi:hypothetical protein